MVVSSRGTPMLVAGGIRFYKEKSFGMKVRWQCSFRKLFKCKSFIRTVEKTVVCSNFQHNHDIPRCDTGSYDGL